MKLTVRLIDSRAKQSTYYQSNPDIEEYDRVAFSDMDASPAVLAATLRGIADSIDPATRPNVIHRGIADGGVALA